MHTCTCIIYSTWISLFSCVFCSLVSGSFISNGHVCQSCGFGEVAPVIKPISAAQCLYSSATCCVPTTFIAITLRWLWCLRHTEWIHNAQLHYVHVLKILNIFITFGHWVLYTCVTFQCMDNRLMSLNSVGCWSRGHNVLAAMRGLTAVSISDQWAFGYALKLLQSAIKRDSVTEGPPVSAR